MTKKRRILPTPLECLFLLSLTGLLAFVLYPAIRSIQNPRGPHGEMYPTLPPDEANRISTSSGLSIVVPQNWEPLDKLNTAMDAFSIAPRGTPGRRSLAMLNVRRWSKSPQRHTLAGFKKRQFQGHAAYEKTTINRKGSFDDPAQSTYELFIIRNSQWWHISFLVADEMAILDPRIVAYIDTVTFPGPANN